MSCICIGYCYPTVSCIPYSPEIPHNSIFPAVHRRPPGSIGLTLKRRSASLRCTQKKPASGFHRMPSSKASPFATADTPTSDAAGPSSSTPHSFLFPTPRAAAPVDGDDDLMQLEEDPMMSATFLPHHPAATPAAPLSNCSGKTNAPSSSVPLWLGRRGGAHGSGASLPLGGEG